MNPTAIAYAIQLMSALPGLIKAGIDVTDTIRSSTQKMTAMEAEKRGPTDAEWDELNRRIATHRADFRSATPGGTPAT